MASSGLSDPLLTIDSLHRGAAVAIVAAIALSITLVSLLIRLYVRLSLSAQFGNDDIVVLAATIFACGQSATVFWEVSKGLGTSIELISTNDLRLLQKAALASDICYLITIYLAKCSIVGMFLRLTPNKRHNRASWATLALSTIWVIPAIFMISVHCGLKQPWANIAEQCTNLYLRWQLITAFNVITEVCLFILAVFLLRGLRMALREKSTVLSAFASRLPLIAFAVVRLHYLKIAVSSPNITLNLVNTSIWSQIELNYSVVACTTFCLKPFVLAVSTNYGTAGSGALEASGMRSSLPKSGYSFDPQRSKGSFALQSMTNSIRDLKISKPVAADGTKLNSVMFRGDKVDNTTTVTLDRNRGANSIGSDDSTKLIIKKDVGYTIEYAGIDENGARTPHQ